MLRVLVIDDEKNILTTLTVCLEGMGCAVTAVSSPQTALAALARQAVDLAFLDLRLREASGLREKTWNNATQTVGPLYSPFGRFQTPVTARGRNESGSSW